MMTARFSASGRLNRSRWKLSTVLMLLVGVFVLVICLAPFVTLRNPFRQVQHEAAPETLPALGAVPQDYFKEKETPRIVYVTKEASSSFDMISWPTEDQGSMGFLYRSQFPEARGSTCADEQFIVWTFPKYPDTRNLAAIYTTLGHWLSFAIKNRRILILDDAEWQLGDCDSKNTECYFKPTSSCTMQDVKSRSTQKFASNEEKPDYSKDVWAVPGRWWIAHTQEDVYGIGSTEHPCHWHEMAMLFFFRLQPFLKAKIEDNIRAALADHPEFDPSRAIGLPIRASDKCKGHSLSKSAAGEMHCITLESYMEFADKVRAMDPHIDTLVLTSEDPDVIKDITTNQAMLDKGWKFVLNVRDVKQGTGSASALVHEASNQGKKVRIADVMESALTSLHLQLRTRYLLATQRSSWLLLIALMHKCDSCTFATERKQLFIDRGTKVNYYC